MKRLHIIISLLVLTLALLLVECFQKEEIVVTPNNINFDNIPLKNLSEYGFFLGDQLSDLIPSDGVLLYEPSSSLFTDYAHKSRYIWMPEGVSASILDNEWQQIEFPDKTIIIKNFYYPKDFNYPEGKKNIIETRLLVKNNGKWQAYPYLWNEEQTDAKLNLIGGKYSVTFADEKGITHNIDYLQPNKNQCKSCHSQDEKFIPLGTKARNLNFTLDYGNGEVKNQLEKWVEMGYLDNYTSSEKYTAVVNYNHTNEDLELRAKAYLDANCAHCHNPKGPASTSGLFLTYETSDYFRWGVNKVPVAAGIGAGPHKYDIYPGKADSSILIYRMNSTQPGVAMAEIGRVMIHKEGVELISEWINAM